MSYLVQHAASIVPTRLALPSSWYVMCPTHGSCRSPNAVAHMPTAFASGKLQKREVERDERAPATCSMEISWAQDLFSKFERPTSDCWSAWKPFCAVIKGGFKSKYFLHICQASTNLVFGVLKTSLVAENAGECLLADRRFGSIFQSIATWPVVLLAWNNSHRRIQN